MAILDVRGTHGSGKSSIVHSLLKTYEHEPILSDEDKILGYYIPELDCAIVGRYSNQCGGCDGIKSAKEVCDRVVEFSSKYKNVILEGILVSHTFSRYNELAVQLEDKNYKFLFLDTPLETCIDRVKKRRELKGNTKELNPKNITKDWHNIWLKVRSKMVESGRTVVVLKHKNPLPKVLELLTES